MRMGYVVSHVGRQPHILPCLTHHLCCNVLCAAAGEAALERAGERALERASERALERAGGVGTQAGRQAGSVRA